MRESITDFPALERYVNVYRLWEIIKNIANEEHSSTFFSVLIDFLLSTDLYTNQKDGVNVDCRSQRVHNV